MFRLFKWQAVTTVPTEWKLGELDRPGDHRDAAKCIAVAYGLYGVEIHIAEDKPGNLHANGAPFCVHSITCEIEVTYVDVHL